MMTILPTINSEKRPFDSLPSISNNSGNRKNDTSDENPAKRVKRIPKTEGSSDTNTTATESFSSKMIIQLAKSAISSLDENRTENPANGYEESAIDSLAHSISLPVTNPKSVNSHHLLVLLSQLTTEIARFDNNRALPLIHSILKINWIYHASKHQNFSKHYATFLTVLVSTIPLWWKDVASKIISDFSKADPSVLKSHHETLKKLISLAPTASNALPKLLKLNFPNKNAPKNEIINYVKNILCVSEYYVVLTNNIWILIFENFVKLDVEFQNQIDEIDDDDLSEVLGLDDSDNEENNDEDDDENDVDSDIDSGIESDSDDLNDNNLDNKNDDIATKIKINTVENEFINSDNNDSDSDNENDRTSANTKTVIKKVKFEENKNDQDDPAHEDDDEFDDEMLDSEAEYTIELESVSELSLKIDNLLTSILEYLVKNLSVNSLESGQGIPIFNSLVNAFTSIVLPTHGTKATQYILFYAAQQQPELIDAFLVTLFEIVFSTDKRKGESSTTPLSSLLSSSNNSSSNIHLKITGVQYIASFVARAKNLSDIQIKSVVTFLIDYCTAYMEEHDDDDVDVDVEMGNTNSNSSSRNNSSNYTNIKREFNPNKHSLFYSLVQALMYIVCFRKSSLHQSDDDDSKNSNSINNHKTGWVASLDKFFTRVIISKYDPLRWCNETVVLIFSRVAQSEGICYTWSVLERIKRERVGRVTSDKREDKKNIQPSSTTSSVATSAASTLNITAGTQSSIRATQEFLDRIAFFPFDPLLLKKSRQIVETSYVQWDGGDDEDDENESDLEDGIFEC